MMFGGVADDHVDLDEMMLSGILFNELPGRGNPDEMSFTLLNEMQVPGRETWMINGGMPNGGISHSMHNPSSINAHSSMSAPQQQAVLPTAALSSMPAMRVHGTAESHPGSGCRSTSGRDASSWPQTAMCELPSGPTSMSWPHFSNMATSLASNMVAQNHSAGQPHMISHVKPEPGTKLTRGTGATAGTATTPCEFSPGMNAPLDHMHQDNRAAVARGAHIMHPQQKLQNAPCKINGKRMIDEVSKSNGGDDLSQWMGRSPVGLGRPLPGISVGPATDPVPSSTRGGGRSKKTPEQQRADRRERNRRHARCSRARKKLLIDALQNCIESLQRENANLSTHIRRRFGEEATKKLIAERSLVPQEEESSSCVSEDPSKATTILEQNDFALLRALQSGQQNFVITDARLPDNPIVFASHGFIKITGYSLEQVLGRNCRFLQGPETNMNEVSRIQKALAAGEEVSACVLNYRIDGTQFWNQLYISPLRNNEGEVVNFVGVQCEVSPQLSLVLSAPTNSSNEDSYNDQPLT